MADRTPSPGELWEQANGDGAEYRRLLREHGMLVDRKPGDDPNLPCGWPGKRVAEARCCYRHSLLCAVAENRYDACCDRCPELGEVWS